MKPGRNTQVVALVGYKWILFETIYFGFEILITFILLWVVGFFY